MIYQCYFQESQKKCLFKGPLYRGFGLYSQVNPNITRNCPELEKPAWQQQLCEYAAMLHLWRNPEVDGEPWIGFTSYRQLDKFPTILQDRPAVERHLQSTDILGWGVFSFADHISGRPLTLAEQAERCHPGLNSALWRLLMLHNEPLPENYLLANSGLFCNYWIMAKENFQQYMQWSAPLVRYALEHPDPFFKSTPRALSYLIERLFICWYGIQRKTIRNIGSTGRIRCGNGLYRALARPQQAGPMVLSGQR